MADVKVKIAADGAKQFKSDLSDIVAQSKLLDSELKLVSSSFDKTTSAQKKAAAENKVLTKQIETQKSKIDLLKDEIARASAKYGENDKYVVKLKTDLNKAETALNGMEQKVKANGNAFTRFGDKIKGLVSSFKEGENRASASSSRTSAVLRLSSDGMPDTCREQARTPTRPWARLSPNIWQRRTRWAPCSRAPE